MILISASENILHGFGHDIAPDVESSFQPDGRPVDLLTLDCCI
jgi:hypothetical protein